MSPPPADKMTPPMGVIALFTEVKKDLREAIDADKKDHDRLWGEIKTVRTLNEKQSRSLERIEGALGVRAQTVTESGRTRRKLITVIGALLTIVATGMVGYYFGG